MNLKISVVYKKLEITVKNVTDTKFLEIRCLNKNFHFEEHEKFSAEEKTQNLQIEKLY